MTSLITLSIKKLSTPQSEGSLKNIRGINGDSIILKSGSLNYDISGENTRFLTSSDDSELDIIISKKGSGINFTYNEEEKILGIEINGENGGRILLSLDEFEAKRFLGELKRLSDELPQ